MDGSNQRKRNRSMRNLRNTSKRSVKQRIFEKCRGMSKLRQSKERSMKTLEAKIVKIIYEWYQETLNNRDYGRYTQCPIPSEEIMTTIKSHFIEIFNEL